MQNKEDKHLYDSLISGYLNGELASAEVRELTDWIRLDKENKRYFDECCEIWITAKAAGNNHNFNVQKGFWDFRQKLNATVTAQHSRGKARPLMIFARYAAIIILTFSLSGLLFYFIGRGSSHKPDYNFSELIVPLGSRAKFLLPDGTVVNLNAGSRLRYDRMYGINERLVELEGEAYFIVARDPGNPFTVKTSHLNVTAVGTEFNIKAYPGDETIETTLVEGSISVEPLSAGNNATLLKPNQKLTFIKSGIAADSLNTHANDTNEKIKRAEPPITASGPILIMENVNVFPEISWKEKRWIFEQKNLSDIAIELERRYDVEIIIESERLNNFRLTGTIIEEPIEQVLEVMSMTALIEFSLKGRVVTLWENKNFEELNKNLYKR